jgi:hypothetical protein
MYLPDVDRDPPGTYPECLHDGGGVSRNAEETSEPVRIEMPNETSVLRQKCHAINDLENARNRVRIPASQPTSLAPLARWLLGTVLGFDRLAALAALGTNPCLPAIRLRSRHNPARDSGGWLTDMMRSAVARSAKVDESLPPSQIHVATPSSFTVMSCAFHFERILSDR